MPPVRQIKPDQFATFRAALEAQSFSFEERPHQVFLARKEGAAVNLYQNGKVVIGGSDAAETQAVHTLLDSLGAAEVQKKSKELPSIDVSGTRIGTDEVGKGDYFGPLVVAGVLVTDETERELKALGVRDSKTLSDTTVANLALNVRRILGRQNYEEIWISPLKYNLLYQKLRNVNRILGWAHARAMENLLSNGIGCDKAIADQFGNQSYIEDALMRKGRQIRLIQVHHAERDTAVAAASILARDKFLSKLEETRESYQLDFPKGASNVVEFGKKLVESHGIGVLQNVAKLHFRTTREITGGVLPIIKPDVESKADLETLPREPAQRELREASLEIFNLISNFEIEFREFIKARLEEHYGPEWWEKGVDENIRKKCEGRQRDELKKGRKVELMECLEFPHYRLIITDRRNWEEIFSKYFRDKEKVMARLTVLRDWRDPVYHARGTIGPKETSEVVGAVNQLRRMMRLQPGLDDFGGAG